MGCQMYRHQLELDSTIVLHWSSLNWDVSHMYSRDRSRGWTMDSTSVALVFLPTKRLLNCWELKQIYALSVATLMTHSRAAADRRLQIDRKSASNNAAALALDEQSKIHVLATFQYIGLSAKLKFFAFQSKDHVIQMLYFRIDSSHVFLLLLLIGGKKWLGNVFAGYWLWSYDIKQ